MLEINWVMNELQSLVIVLSMKLYKLSCILKLIKIFGEGDNSDTYSGASKKVGIWPKYKMNNFIQRRHHMRALPQ